MRGQSAIDHAGVPVSKAIQDLIAEPAVELSPDMGLGSREQGFVAQRPKRQRFVLSEQVAAERD